MVTEEKFLGTHQKLGLFFWKCLRIPRKYKKIVVKKIKLWYIVKSERREEK